MNLQADGPGSRPGNSGDAVLLAVADAIRRLDDGKGHTADGILNAIAGNLARRDPEAAAVLRDYCPLRPRARSRFVPEDSIGRRIRILPGASPVLMRRFGPDGHHDGGDSSARRLAAGEEGVITGYTQHGYSPYTRYTAVFPGGWTAHDIAPAGDGGHDFAYVSGPASRRGGTPQQNATERAAAERAAAVSRIAAAGLKAGPGALDNLVRFCAGRNADAVNRAGVRVQADYVASALGPESALATVEEDLLPDSSGHRGDDRDAGRPRDTRPLPGEAGPEA